MLASNVETLKKKVIKPVSLSVIPVLDFPGDVQEQAAEESEAS